MSVESIFSLGLSILLVIFILYSYKKKFGSYYISLEKEQYKYEYKISYLFPNAEIKEIKLYSNFKYTCVEEMIEKSSNIIKKHKKIVLVDGNRTISFYTQNIQIYYMTVIEI